MPETIIKNYILKHYETAPLQVQKETPFSIKNSNCINNPIFKLLVIQSNDGGEQFLIKLLTHFKSEG